MEKQIDFGSKQGYMDTHYQGKALPARSYCDLAESEKQHILKGYVAVADDGTLDKIHAMCRRCGDIMYHCPITMDNIDRVAWHWKHPDCFGNRWSWWKGSDDSSWSYIVSQSD